MSNSRSTYVLIGLFFTALLGLWGLERAGVLTEAERDRRRDRVFPDLIDLDELSIRKVELDRGNERLVFERRGANSWRITSPIDAEASSGEVDGLVAILKSLKKSPEAGALGGSPGEFGLDPPAAIVRVWTDPTAEPTAMLEVGRTIQEEIFVRPGPKAPVMVTLKRALTATERPIGEWRASMLVPPTTDPVVGLQIRRRNFEASAERTARGGWKLTTPIAFPADGKILEKVIADITSIRIDPKGGFVADDVQDFRPYGLAPPEATVVLSFAGISPPLTVMVGASPTDRPDRIFVRKDGEDDVLEVGAEFVADLPSSLKSLRSQLVADFPPAAVQRILVNSEHGEFDLERDRVGWLLKSADSSRAERQQAESLLRALVDLRAVEFLDPALSADSGVEPPRMRIRVWTGEPGRAEPDFDLALGRSDALTKTVLGRLKGDEAILALPEAFVHALPASKFAFRDLELPSVRPEKISRLTIERPGRTTVVQPAEDAGSPNRWTLERPVKADADTRAVTAALARLAQLRATAFVAEAGGDLARFGLDRPILDIRWQTGEPGDATSAEGSLKIGSPLKDDPSRHYGVIDGFPAVFSIETGALMPFAAEFRDTRILSFPPQTVRRIVLKSETRTRAYSRRRQPLGNPSDWSAEAGTPPNGVDLSAFEDLVKGLSDLHTQRFVQYLGPFPSAAGLASPRLSVTIDFGPEKPPATLRIGARFIGGWVCAATGDGLDGPVFLLEGPSWESLILGVEGGLPPIPPDLFAPAG